MSFLFSQVAHVLPKLVQDMQLVAIWEAADIKTFFVEYFLQFM